MFIAVQIQSSKCAVVWKPHNPKMYGGISEHGDLGPNQYSFDPNIPTIGPWYWWADMSILLALLYIFSLSLVDDTKSPTRADVYSKLYWLI